MVLLTISPNLLSAIEKYNDSHPWTEDADPAIKQAALGQPISHDQIIQISRALRNEPGGSNHHLSDLLRGVSIYVEPPKPKPQQVCLTSET